MSRRRKLKSKSYEIEIESLSHEGRGISHIDNKVIFTRGALPGEKVIASRTLSRAKYEEADITEILEPSSDSTYRAKIKLMQNRTGFKAPLRGKPR